MDKAVDIFKVADLAGVSKSTVSRAINDSYGVSEDAKKKVFKAMAELKYKPNISARQLRTKANTLLGILISKENSSSSISSSINAQKISGIVDKCSERGFDTLIFIEDIKDVQRLNLIIQNKGLSGILLLDIVPDDVLISLKNYNIPYVIINWISKNVKDTVVVKTDLVHATTIALEHLIEKGYKEIGLVNWEDQFLIEKEIENTFTSIMSKYKLNQENSFFNTELWCNKEDVCNYIEKSKKKAYICFSYTGSINIIQYCKENNISVPQDLALISYEFFEFFDYLSPKLTGIRQKTEYMGALAAEKLMDIIEGKKDIKSEYIKPSLIIKETT